jgi:hypothetical protein
VRIRTGHLLLAALAVLGVFFLNTWQGFRFQVQEREVKRLEQEQRDWVEENKKIVAAMAILSSPARLQRLAESRLGLRRLDADREMKLRLGGAAGGQNE